MHKMIFGLRPWFACAIMSLCGGVYAEGWDITPFLSVKEVYSDNIEHRNALLAEGDFVTELAPGLNAVLDSSRIQADIFYRLQSLYYSNDSESHESYQQLNAKLNLEVMHDAFFIDARTSLAQQVVDPAQPVSLRNLAISSNRADVATASVNPYWQNRWDNNIESLLSVRTAKVDYDESRNPAAVDSHIDSLNFNLSANKNPESNLSLDFGFSADKIDYQNQIENEFKQAFVTAEARFGGKTALSVTVGNESNEFQTQNQESPKGDFWKLGLRLAPARRHHLEISIGNRFFGSTGSFEWLYTGRRWEIETRYQEDFFTDAQRQLETGRRFSDTDLSQASTGVYLRERMDADFSYHWSKTQIRLGAFGEVREFQSIQREDTLYGGSLSWNWRLASQTQLLTEYRQRRDKLDMLALDNQVYQLSSGLQRQLSKRLNVMLEIGRERLVSTNVLNDYQENWLSASMEQQF